jgi:hypothetical protein
MDSAALQCDRLLEMLQRVGESPQIHQRTAHRHLRVSADAVVLRAMREANELGRRRESIMELAADLMA